MLYSLKFKIGVHLLKVELSQLLTPVRAEYLRSHWPNLYTVPVPLFSPRASFKTKLFTFELLGSNILPVLYIIKVRFTKILSTELNCNYRKVARTSPSRLEAHAFSDCL